ncbi:MAG: MaoC/PaaZ C-terminal domain-containing protein [Myxococcota bacterium]
MTWNLARIGVPVEARPLHYDADRTVAYALACGATTEELDYLLESRGPEVLPSFAVVPAFPAVVQALSEAGADLVSVLHGAQRIEVLRPFPEEAELRTTATPTALYDKGKGALLVVETESADASGPICRTEWQLYFRGLGNFGGERGPPAPDTSPPEGPPDAVLSEATLLTQALLYRVASGDKNPIHAEPAIAQALGFERPILHGLCTLGFATRAVLGHLGPKVRLRTIEGRFASPVLPSETLSTHVWSSVRHFETRVGDKTVISRGRWTTAD